MSRATRGPLSDMADSPFPKSSRSYDVVSIVVEAGVLRSTPVSHHWNGRSAGRGSTGQQANLRMRDVPWFFFAANFHRSCMAMTQRYFPGNHRPPKSVSVLTTFLRRLPRRGPSPRCSLWATHYELSNPIRVTMPALPSRKVRRPLWSCVIATCPEAGGDFRGTVSPADSHGFWNFLRMHRLFDSDMSKSTLRQRL